MENYKFHRFLRDGPKGQASLVENKKSGKKYVLKKIECTDATEASKTMKSVIFPSHMSHPYISACKDCFVTWEEDDSAVFICIVTDYYEFGNISEKIEMQRTNGDILDETLIRKWIGQMLEAIAFIHEHKITHGNLKPSNILLTENLDILICDFDVLPLRDDTRVNSGDISSSVWMAPEVSQTGSEKASDIWSLGCITLEMITCSFLDAHQFSSLIIDTKSSPCNLEDILNKVHSKFHGLSPLCNAVQKMLETDLHLRPAITALLKLPFLSECYASNNSMLIALELKRETITKLKAVFKEIAKERNFYAVLAFMEENVNNPWIQIIGLDTLLDLHNEGIAMDMTIKEMIISVMKTNRANVNVQIISCLLLAAVATNIMEGDVMYTNILIAPLALSMKTHLTSLKLQVAATNLIKHISIDTTAVGEIGIVGGVQDILAALRAFPNDVEITQNCCYSLSTLAINQMNSKIICEERALRDICASLKIHCKISAIVEAACSALCSLSLEYDNVENMFSEGAVRLVIQSLDIHKEKSKVVKHVCMALANIAESDESSAYEILYGERNTPGIDIMVDALKLHNTCGGVVESFACCIAKIAAYGDLRPELRLKGIHNHLLDVRLRFVMNSPVLSQIDKAIFLIGEAVPDVFKKQLDN